jgi:NAD-dependent dihydropyrimidine dehydrogenase PreA subunit
VGKYGEWKGVPREQVPWYPAIDVEKCTGCRTCFEFCGHHVYAWDDAADRPRIAEPFQCVVGCSGCSHQCEQMAISFPPLSVLAGIGNQEGRRP